MSLTNNFFAVDLGATSGRTILGTLSNGKVDFKEITRFSNPIVEVFGHFHWDILHLYNEIINGLKCVKSSGVEINSIGIDTWGVDFALFGKDGHLLGDPYSYRDPHKVGSPDEYFKTKVPKKDVYNLTGTQIIDINSLFQLYTLRKNNYSALENVSKILFMPDAISYLLTGEMVTEYTIASTSQLLNPRTKKLDDRLLKSVGLSQSNFGRYVFPGDKVGTINKTVQKLTGLGPIPVFAVAGHDTASAVAATPAKNERFAYLSSGTWSLMGIEVKNAIINEESFDKNFTNEGGVNGTTRFLKNICGMWLIEGCRKLWGDSCGTFKDIERASAAVKPFRSLINPDSPIFSNPPNMLEAIQKYCTVTNQPKPSTIGEFSRCIYDSLSLRYRQVYKDLQHFALFNIDALNVIGGGSVNTFMNHETCNALQIPVHAGPREATALGNICIQAKAMGMIDNVRDTVRNSVTIEEFMPEDADLWNEGYDKYLKIFREDI
ncbi:hypothetical protein M9Y10_033876 [Tritrichomonas musculus]|uniref:Rhamnulokinase n=1 Tax=Tritrichomonas musculus TaxID=1915356 RepID=A0ABR2KDD0_9EUKA